MLKIAHLTSVHHRYDTRIFFKECQSLAGAGYHVSLVVADGKEDEVKEGVMIFDVGTCRGRVNRTVQITGRVFKKAKSLNADIYHLHDPELIPVGLKLKRQGKKVIFDSHEDVPKQILGKHYLNKSTRWFISQIFSAYEKWACKRFHAIITATPCIRDKFLTINSCSVDINNFPLLGELTPATSDWSTKRNHVCYVGNITRIRGIKEIVQAMGFVDNGIRLQLGGTFGEPVVEFEVKKYKGWAHIDELGRLNRKEVREVLSDSVAGLVTFYSLPNHIDAQPNKMFEYMSAAIPVIASNFLLWRDIIDTNQCGICVDPLDPHDIARAINKMVADPELAARMGANGQKAIKEMYNWENEEKKLLDLYWEIV